MIRGEYWIQDGYVDFADGDIGDKNHEGIAIDSIFSQFADEVDDLSQEFKLNKSANRYGDVDIESVSEILTQIYEKLTESKTRRMSGAQADAYIMKYLGCNGEALRILTGGSGAREYVMEHMGWIAVRGHNIELYGYNVQKQSQIAEGVRDIIDQEGYDSENLNPEEIELWIEDNKTRKTWSVTLADLEQPEVVARPSQSPNTSQNFSYRLKDKEENKYQQQSKSKINPWNVAAKKAGIGTELWRNTSECKFYTFKEWLKKKSL